MGAVVERDPTTNVQLLLGRLLRLNIISRRRASAASKLLHTRGHSCRNGVAARVSFSSSCSVLQRRRHEAVRGAPVWSRGLVNT